MHRLLLFGAGSIQGPHGPVTGRAGQGYRLALLARLAVEHPRPLTRDRLITLLWPDHDAVRGRRLLRQSLYILRRVLGEEAVLSGGSELRLDPQWWSCDLWDFRSALDEGDHEDAIALYSGPFLDGAAAGGGSEFEHWAEVERVGLARRYAEALEAVAERYEATGEWGAAAGAWRRLADHDPYDSRVAIRLMQALDAIGNRAAALRHAAEHDALVRAEFGTDPDPEIQACTERLRDRSRMSADDRPHETAVPVAFEKREQVRVSILAASGSAVEAAAREAAAGAGGPPSSHRSGRPEPLPARLRRWWVAALAGLAMIGAVAWLGGRSPVDESAWASTAAVEHDRSLAVLPFADLSADGDGEYFSDGVTEEIISQLAKIGELRVISRTSVMRYKGADRSLPGIARELGVAYVLEGSVRRSGDRLRVTAQLIDARSDAHLWAHSYDRELSAETLFGIQGDIAQRIAAALRAEISPAERQRIERPPTRDLAAYDYYLRGREAMKPFGPRRLEWAVSLFERALELDPHFVLAEAYRGETYGMMWRRTRREEYRDSALASHLRVFRDAPDMPEGHRLLGRHHHSAGRLNDAHVLYLRALELDPNDAGALYDLARIYEARGRFDLALAPAKRSAALAPTTMSAARLVFLLYLRLGDVEGAERWYRRGLETFPGSPQPYAEPLFRLVHEAALHLMRGDRGQVLAALDSIRRFGQEEPSVISFLAATSLHAGDLEGARREYERQHEIYPDRRLSGLPGLAYTHWQAGDRQRAEAMLREAVQAARLRLAEGDESADPYVVLARVHAIRGETDVALQNLEAAYARGWRDHYYTARFDPRYESLRGHPRFERLMAAVRDDVDRMRTRLRDSRPGG
jgi:TolB-like protein/DNA-binding SARP family transcriptional activator